MKNNNSVITEKISKNGGVFTTDGLESTSVPSRYGLGGFVGGTIRNNDI